MKLINSKKGDNLTGIILRMTLLVILIIVGIIVITNPTKEVIKATASQTSKLNCQYDEIAILYSQDSLDRCENDLVNKGVLIKEMDTMKGYFNQLKTNPGTSNDEKLFKITQCLMKDKNYNTFADFEKEVFAYRDSEYKEPMLYVKSNENDFALGYTLDCLA